MRTGRPKTERGWVVYWLKGFLVGEPKSVIDIKKRTQFSWRTTEQAKREIGAKSKKVAGQWFWYLPGQSETPKANQTISNGPEQPDVSDFFNDTKDDTPVYTQGMISTARFMHLVKHENETKIVKAIVKDCQTYPNDPPYPESYIRAIVDHVVYGKPRPPLPDGIIEPK